jgi:hypothetical protein
MDEPAHQPVVPESQQVMPQPAPAPSAPPAPLIYEETPEIPMDIKPTKKRPSFLKIFGIIIAFLALFVIGVNVSSSIRKFLPSGLGNNTETQNTTNQPSITPSAGPAAEWKTYDVISGVTKLAIAGVTFQLPPDVLPPICDGVGCASQGTYLPGGTRLTIAPRGTGQALRDFRGTVISDANGVPIPIKQLLVGQITATEYESSGSGKTVSGYAFSRMRGVMIPLTDTLSVEVNHFTPNGVSADFEKDDLLFNEIIKTFTFTSPAATVTPTIAPVATSSGY